MSERIKSETQLTTEVAELFPRRGQWKEDDYFALPDTNRIVELSEGEFIMPPHPTFSHQSALDMLYASLRAFIVERNLGILRFAPLPIRLWPDKIREPDIVFFLNEHTDRIGEQFCETPDLVVEILSPATRKTDRGDKFYEYARAGVSEYWMVDLDAHTIEVYFLQAGAYSLVGKFGKGEKAFSKLLSGFEVEVDRIVARS